MPSGLGVACAVFYKLPSSVSTSYLVDFREVPHCATLPLTVATDLDLAAVFAARLSVLMAEHGDSQAALARSGDVSCTQQTLSLFLAGKHVPNAVLVAQVARRYNVSTDWLLGLSIERRPLSAPPYGWVDDEALRLTLSDDPRENASLRSGRTVLQSFPPHARLVDAAEFTVLSSRLDATHRQGLGERLRARLRGRPKKK